MLGIRGASEINDEDIAIDKAEKMWGTTYSAFKSGRRASDKESVLDSKSPVVSLFTHHVELTRTVSLGRAAYPCFAPSPAESFSLDQFTTNSTIRLMASHLITECHSR